jgi:hypothetical protein
VGRAGSRLCRNAGFGISGVEPSGVGPDSCPVTCVTGGILLLLPELKTLLAVNALSLPDICFRQCYFL